MEMQEQAMAKNHGSEVSPLSYSQAVKLFDEAKQALEVARPKQEDVGSIPGANDDWHILPCLGYAFVGVGSFIASILTTSPIIALGTGVLAFLGMSCAMLMPTIHVNAENKLSLRSLKLAKLTGRLWFFVKKERKWLDRKIESIETYERKMEAYRLFVAKIADELEYSGVNAMLNDMHNPKNYRFFELDNVGKFHFLTRDEVEEAIRKDTMSSPAVFQQKIVDTVTDSKPVLGSGRDFKEIFDE